jgi:hydrogenase/urease accessory protein HupE
MCLAQWVATALALGLMLAPSPTRLAMSIFTAVAGADFLQHGYAWLQQAAE